MDLRDSLTLVCPFSTSAWRLITLSDCIFQSTRSGALSARRSSSARHPGSSNKSRRRQPFVFHEGQPEQSCRGRSYHHHISSMCYHLCQRFFLAVHTAILNSSPHQLTTSAGRFDDISSRVLPPGIYRCYPKVDPLTPGSGEH